MVIDRKTNVSSLFIVDEKLRWRYPKKDKDEKNVVIRIVIDNKWHLVHLDCDYDLMSEEVQMLVVSYLAYRAPRDGVFLRMSMDKLDRYELVGAAPEQMASMTEADLELLMEKDNKPYTVGWLYNHSDFKVIQEDASILTLPGTFLVGCFDDEISTNDCVIHALNYALSHPWFTRREQVVRQIHKRLKGTFEDAIKQKVRGGVTGKQLTQFALVGNEAWSLV